MKSLSIELNYCIFKCKNCTSRFTCRVDIDKLRICEKIINTISQYKNDFDIILFTSGEPLIYLDIVDRIVEKTHPSMLILLSTLEYNLTISNIRRLIEIKNKVSNLDIVVTLNLKTSKIHYNLKSIYTFLKLTKDLNELNITITPKIMINEDSNKILKLIDVFNKNNGKFIKNVMYAFEYGYDYNDDIDIYKPLSYSLDMHVINMDELYTLFIDNNDNVRITHFIDSISSECTECVYTLFCPYKLYSHKPVCKGGDVNDKVEKFFLQKR